MRLCGVTLVIIDGAHFMDLSLKEGKVVNDHLKYIANHTAATFIYTGVDLKHSGLFLEGTRSSRANQTAGRNTLTKMNSYGIHTREQRDEWLTVLLAMDHHKHKTLARLYEHLHHRTAGSICALSDLIREAAIEAVMTGKKPLPRTCWTRSTSANSPNPTTRRPAPSRARSDGPLAAPKLVGEMDIHHEATAKSGTAH